MATGAGEGAAVNLGWTAEGNLGLQRRGEAINFVRALAHAAQFTYMKETRSLWHPSKFKLA